MSLSLRRLRYFRSIVAEGSFTAAAARLGIAQPALSHTIAQLEDHFGHKLLIRDRKGVTPTPEGERVLASARGILDTLSELEADLSPGPGEVTGRVTIGLAVTLARQVAPRLLTRMAERHPKVHVDIEVTLSTDATAMLSRREADYAVVPLAAHQPNIATRPLYREQVCLAQLAQSVNPDTRPVAFKDLANIPLVLSRPNYDLRRRIDLLSRELGVVLDIRYEQNSPEAMLGIVLAGLSSTLTQMSVFHPTMERPLLDIRPVIEPRIMRTHMLCRLASQTPDPAQRALEHELCSCFEDLTRNASLPGDVIADGAWSDGSALA